MRPERLILVTGTHTEVGKTWWTAGVAAELRGSGARVAARKPVQSYATGDPGPTDAEALAAATGERPDLVCAHDRSYPLALAPPMAADILGVDCPSIDDIVQEIAWPPDVAFGFVEGVGGPRSPLASDGDTVDLAAALRPDLVVVVADAALGAINAVLLAVAPFAPTPVVVALNRFDAADDVHRRNRAWLADRSGLRVVTMPQELATSVSRNADFMRAEP